MGSRLWALRWRLTAPVVLLQRLSLVPGSRHLWAPSSHPLTSSSPVSSQLWGLCTVLPGFCRVKTQNCRGPLATVGRVDVSGCCRWAIPCLSNLSSLCSGLLWPAQACVLSAMLSTLPLGNVFFIKLSPFTSSLTASLTTLRPFLCVPDPSVNCQLLCLSLRPYSSGLTSCVPNPVSTFNSRVWNIDIIFDFFLLFILVIKTVSLLVSYAWRVFTCLHNLFLKSCNIVGASSVQ